MRDHANIAIFVPHIGCPHQCSFCNQHSISGQQQPPTGATVQAVCRRALGFIPKEERAKGQIAFFGGSFTAIERPLMVQLLEAALPFVEEHGFSGIRISTRPDAIDEGVLSLLKRYRVTAIELGAQSMKDEVLQKNRRGHTAREVKRACQMIREYGFELGLQMMVGLYGDTEQGAITTAYELAALSPSTVRIYPTVVLRGTMLAELYQQGVYRPISVSEAVRISTRLLCFFEERGIRVIRLGLHASVQLERDILAGGYHPALRELCESQLFLQKITTQLEQTDGGQAAEISILVPKGCLSKAVGHCGGNRAVLLQRGIRPCFVEAEALRGYDCVILPQTGGKREVEACI